MAHPKIYSYSLHDIKLNLHQIIILSQNDEVAKRTFGASLEAAQHFAPQDYVIYRLAHFCPIKGTFKKDFKRICTLAEVFHTPSKPSQE